MLYLNSFSRWGVNEATTALINWIPIANLGKVFNEDFVYELENSLPGSVEDLRQASQKIGGPDVDKALGQLGSDLSKRWVPLVYEEINIGQFNAKGSLETLHKIVIENINKQISSIGFIKRKSMGVAMNIKFQNRNKFLTSARTNDEFGPKDLKDIIYRIYELIFNKIDILNIDRNLPKKQQDSFSDKLYQVQTNFRKSLGLIKREIKGGTSVVLTTSQSDTQFFEQVMSTVWDAI